MIITNGNKNYDIQLVPLHGFAVGYLYYHPAQEGDDEEEWSRHQLLFGLFGLLITVWKN